MATLNQCGGKRKYIYLQGERNFNSNLRQDHKTTSLEAFVEEKVDNW